MELIASRAYPPTTFAATASWSAVMWARVLIDTLGVNNAITLGSREYSDISVPRGDRKLGGGVVGDPPLHRRHVFGIALAM